MNPLVFVLFWIDNQNNQSLYGIFTSVEGTEWATKIRPNNHFEKINDGEYIYHLSDGYWKLISYNINRLFMEGHSIDVYGPNIDVFYL